MRTSITFITGQMYSDTPLSAKVDGIEIGRFATYHLAEVELQRQLRFRPLQQGTAHVFTTHAEALGCEGTCIICSVEIPTCGICKSVGGATASECPGAILTRDQLIALYNGTLDFRGGEWVEAMSPHSPFAEGAHRELFPKEVSL